MAENENVLEINGEAFDKEIVNQDKPALVDFWAPWCGPCRMVAPVVEELAEEYEGKIVITKVNVDENPKTASQYGIMSIPSLIIFKGGSPVSNLVGFRPKADLKRSLDEVLD